MPLLYKASTNKIYAGIHWSKRKELKDGIYSVVSAFCGKLGSVVSYPVQIRYRFIFESRALDTFNCAYMAKCIEDALVTLKILQDDDPSHVARSIIEVVKQTDKNGSGNAKKDRKKRQARPKKDEVEVEITSITE